MSSYSLPDLPYAYGALEPHLDARTVELHHTKIHGSYVEQLNSTLAASEELRAAGDQSIEDLLWNLGKIPEDARNAIRNFGGGHANHNLFWAILSDKGGGEPSGSLAQAIEDDFGNFAAFQERFASLAVNHLGSGWVWLVRARNRLVAYTLGNEDSPLTAEEVPILGLDIWEHAYYLQYPARRRDYVDAFWNVVNWEEVSRRFEQTSRR